MLWFDNIYKNSVNTMKGIFEITNSITDLSYKYYISIMAVSTIKCEYLLGYLENKFLLNGGEIDWLILGLSSVPEKLKVLGNINNILAHQPWKLNIKDIKGVLQYWTREELLEAFIIIIVFQRLSTILESLKINLKESDLETSQISEILYSKQVKVENNLFDCLEVLNQEEETVSEPKNLKELTKEISVDWAEGKRVINLKIEDEPKRVYTSRSKFLK